MHVPKSFEVGSLKEIHQIIKSCGLAQFVTYNDFGLATTPVPIFFEESEGENGVIYGHLARINKQAKSVPLADAMLIFQGEDGYISPSWCPTKQETGKMVPTWNYVAVQAFGPVEFFTDKKRLYEVVDKLTNLNEPKYSDWKVSDAPANYTDAMLGAIVGFRVPIARFEASKKLSQNKGRNDQEGIIKHMSDSEPVKELMKEELNIE